MRSGKPGVLISACLMGLPVRYDGQGKPLAQCVIGQLSDACRLVPLCPELAGGFQAPRPPAEIESGATGDDVLDGRAKVIELGGRDVTSSFVAGAESALALAKEQGCRHALLIDGSPSCGSLTVHDGSFSGRKHAGNGVTTALLVRHGIEVYTPGQFEALLARLTRLN